MTVGPDSAGSEGVRRIPARVPARIDGLTSLRTVTRRMTETAVGAVLVESPLGLTGIVTANDVIEAIATGADPDTVWAGEIARPAPRVVSRRQHPAAIAEEMAAHRLEVVALVDADAPVALASALDVLGAVLRATRNGLGTPDRRE